MGTTINLSEYLGVNPASDFDLAEMIERGLPADTLSLLKEKGLTFTEVAELIISPRTLQHRKARGNQQLTNEEADKVVRIARILAFAEQVFGSREKALRWLRKPDDRLHERSRLSMLITESGGRVVEEMLWQIEEGMFT